MPDPVIAAKFPAVVELEPGTYWWCRCGRSQSQPFCDGSSHKVTEFSPLEITVDEKRRLALCQCKRTENEPYCDQAHRKL